MSQLKVRLLLFIPIIFLFIQCIDNSEKINKFDEMESAILKDKIIWNKNKKLKWSDFRYDPTEKSFVIYTNVGLSARYNVDNPIMFRSYTTFSRTKSIVSDTTHKDDLRIAQAKFDLLETYRRKMLQKVDSIRGLKSKNFEKSYFDDVLKKYYNDFDKEWEMYRPITIESLETVERKIEKELNKSY
ncbi:hypothetical protein LX97_01361 [Nonlabens dokdonensis]|jgi:hypothetical protein|uniref:Uncharacterized protein n=2 Tax=Nonlabens dokdonensis TaxID=328515 RepID=L7WCR6_NONDD|nr:hypothetical protein [Nonlabens dokdonensis]AGC76703.1 hypothetical protein DDD_1576 [Nonlabens dokdonensis DSW-6]PZX44350.1 hypothetical protein LX97_01361 [Nonlabens dokdonensis]